MAWESRNGRGAYYTRSRRCQGKVIREYIGSDERGEANARVPFVPSGLRVEFSMFHGLTPMAITFRHFVAMSERGFAATRILIRRSPARRRIEDRI